MHVNQIATIRKTAEVAIRLGSASGVTVDQLTDHMVFVAEVSQETGANLDAMKFPLGVSRETLMIAAAAKNKSNKRRAGAKALVNKYGKDVAEQIIAKKTGKHISLR